MNLYLLSYNNYYNRILKKEETISDYLNYAVHTEPFSVNFNPNDGLFTKHTFNTVNFSAVPDYLLVIDEDNEISSRWFVIDMVRNTKNQYHVTLQRDVMVDYYDEIMDGTFYIEKGNASPNSPLIFNQENMTFNQIKTEEFLLKDETECPWIVGYIPRKLGVASSEDASEQTTRPDYSHSFSLSITPNFVVDAIENWEYYTAAESNKIFKLSPYNKNFEIVFTTVTQGIQKLIQMTETSYTESGLKYGLFLNGFSWKGNKFPTAADTYAAYKPYLADWFDDQLASIGGYETFAKTEDILNLKGKIIKDSSRNTYYQIIIEEGAYTVSPAIYPDSFPEATNIAKNLPCEGDYNGAFGNTFNLWAKGNTAKIILQQIDIDPEDNINYTVLGETVHPNDAPYDIFCIPYGEINVSYEGAETITTSKDAALAVINDYIAENVVGQTNANIYDVQLVPYCPINKVFYSGKDFIINDGLTRASAITQGTEDPKTIGYIFYLDSSSFSVNIEFNRTIENFKMESQTDMYRLCSSNYNGQFEFNAAMNDGISYFTAECTYLPFSPYIHVKPDMKRLYGANVFNDCRGLICGGDFSLPIVNSAWNQYKLLNKNFEQIFARQIDNMRFVGEKQFAMDIVSAITGTIGGAASGAAFGAVSGGGIPGAIIGGVAGGIGSGVAGGFDVGLNQELRNEAIKYARDQYNYNLGNIKAIPQSLTKVSPFTINNRIFPILEYYTCTDEEKNILAKKIAWNGMTINAIGNIQEYLNSWSYKDIESKNYIKGQLIRINIEEDTHIVRAIAEEMNKGVFIK